MDAGLEDVVRGHIVGAPLAALLGVRLARLTADDAVLVLPYREALTTVGDLVRGGAIAALVDVAATAAAWSGADLARRPRGTTVSLAVSFLAAARGGDLDATARVVQRGRSLLTCAVRVAERGGNAVATALVTYKLTHAGEAA